MQFKDASLYFSYCFEIPVIPSTWPGVSVSSESLFVWLSLTEK